MPTPEPTVTVTRYQVGCLPEGHELYSHLSVTVEYRGRGRWAVVDQPYCLSSDGEWDYEIRPSERDDEWIAAHRFDLDTALDLAKEAVPRKSVNGWTAERVLADIAAREAAERSGTTRNDPEQFGTPSDVSGSSRTGDSRG